jgi:hypothetical protein
VLLFFIRGTGQVYKPPGGKGKAKTWYIPAKRDTQHIADVPDTASRIGTVDPSNEDVGKGTGEHHKGPDKQECQTAARCDFVRGNGILV